MIEPNEKIDTYIGDGVYVRFDDYGGVWLYTHDGYSTTNEICLEPEVYYNLTQFVDRHGRSGNEPNSEETH